MDFCPKCGAVLIQKKTREGCPRCSYSSKGKIKIVSSEKMDEKQEAIEVIKKEMDTLPVIVEKCKKCGNDKAYFWTVQTRSGDEAETKFFKCTKCEHVWREYR
ncbi:Transcription factor S [uncultured archaeon]|nr:Transcription factor S [uncultured archaeon]